MNRKMLGLLLLGFLGCAAPSSEEDPAVEETTEELGTSPYRGYFEWDKASNTGRWLEAIALHRDGTFEANVGNNVSNLSGHHYPAAGTYTVAGKVLTLQYWFYGDATDQYDVEVQGDALKMKLRGADTADWFTVHKKKAATLTFWDDWTMSEDGPLIAGAPLVVRYAASRIPCTPPPVEGGLSVVMHAEIDGDHQWGLVQGFGRKPVKGVLGSLGHVPQGQHLAVWFQNGAVGQYEQLTCSAWDSRYGANYHFSIAQP
jgi:hypothetical protein